MYRLDVVRGSVRTTHRFRTRWEALECALMHLRPHFSTPADSVELHYPELGLVRILDRQRPFGTRLRTASPAAETLLVLSETGEIAVSTFLTAGRSRLARIGLGFDPREWLATLLLDGHISNTFPNDSSGQVAT